MANSGGETGSSLLLKQKVLGKIVARDLAGEVGRQQGCVMVRIVFMWAPLAF